MLKYLDRLIGVATSISLFGLMLVTVVDVVSRNILESPLGGMTELTELLLVTSIFLIFPQVSVRGKHITADLLEAVRWKFLRHAQVLVTSVVAVIFFGAASWRLWILGDRAREYGDFTPILHFPIFLVYYFISCLFILTLLAYIVLGIGKLIVTCGSSDELSSAKQLEDAG